VTYFVTYFIKILKRRHHLQDMGVDGRIILNSKVKQSLYTPWRRLGGEAV
jgi:hypothetical protein